MHIYNIPLNYFHHLNARNVIKLSRGNNPHSNLNMHIILTHTHTHTYTRTHTHTHAQYTL
jgi:hypothetical protein